LRRIEALDRARHQRESFDCGEPVLNVFLRQYAARQKDKGISQTFVMVDDAHDVPRPVIGYFTIRPYEIDRDRLPQHLRAGYTNRIGAYLLQKLAVANDQQKRGIGTILISDILRRVMGLIDQGAGVGLFVDAKREEVVSFYTELGFTRLAPDSLELYMPKKTIEEFLSKINADLK
jgi:GNAT superfamily N-acetyltransferase